jgi:hypothetical protein
MPGDDPEMQAPIVDAGVQATPPVNRQRRHFEGGWHLCSDAISDSAGHLCSDAISAAPWQRCDGWFFPSKKQRRGICGVAGIPDRRCRRNVVDASTDVEDATATAPMPTAGGRMPILKSVPRRRQVWHRCLIAGWRRPAPWHLCSDAISAEMPGDGRRCRRRYEEIQEFLYRNPET